MAPAENIADPVTADRDESDREIPTAPAHDPDREVGMDQPAYRVSPPPPGVVTPPTTCPRCGAPLTCCAGRQAAPGA